MQRVGIWLAKQFDGGLTPTGGAIALGLVVCGIGGALALAGGYPWAAVALFGAFLVLLGALLLAALRADPERRIPRAERAERWRRLPPAFKVSFLIALCGPLLAQLAEMLAPGRRLAFSLLCLGAGLASMVFASGMRTHQPPIHLRGAEALTAEAEPERYARTLRAVVRGAYAAGLLLVVAGALALARWPHH